MPCGLVALLLYVLPPAHAVAQDDGVHSTVRTTDAGERILIQELVVEAPVSRVWAAYATAEGWRAWAAPVAEVDLRAGGRIRTHYTPGATLGDPGTIVLRIVNYVPEHVLTLQADVSDRWPDVMKADAEHLMNVVVFDALGPTTTRIRSFGVGYRDRPEYDDLMAFFIPANEATLRQLKAYVEE